jgi:hypothetical protein
MDNITATALVLLSMVSADNCVLLLLTTPPLLLPFDLNERLRFDRLSHQFSNDSGRKLA